MAGGDAAGTSSRELDRTPTWAVSLVTVVIIIISIIIEKVLHTVSTAFHKKKKLALVAAVEKIKAELMILGFISLLMTFGQSYIASICIPVGIANNMWPCAVQQTEGTGDQAEAHRRRLLVHEHRMLAGGTVKSCPAGQVSLISLNGLHQLHVFIFFLAVFHVFYSSMTMILGRLKIRGWKEWEMQIEIETATSNDSARFRLTRETSFVKSNTNWWMQNPFLFYIDCFFRQMLSSVKKSDYLTLRHAFVSVHLSSGTKFNFQKYIKRSLEDDFKLVVGIPPFLWMITVLYQLLNLRGGLLMFWLSLIPMIIILLVGTKLQSIITKMAIEIQEKHAVIQGIPLVEVSDKHFWFGKPHLVLQLMHLALFQNSFEITHFVWIWYEFGAHSCFHRNFSLAIISVVIGVVMQFVCSYITLPLYALVTQMGSHMKKSIFDDQTSKALMSWHHKVKQKGPSSSAHGKKKGGSHDDDSPDNSPTAKSGGIDLEISDEYSSSNSETANITAQVDIAGGEDHTNKDLLTGP